ncbi:MAG: hypothetical protein JWL70_356 [Acidimicrobiia bacterium]|nr:hypothetical protein [Acidimicrobiia bacterium]
MSTIPTTMTTTSATEAAESVQPSHPIRRATLISGPLAALATVAVAAAGDGAGVPLAIDGEAIPLLGFAQMTLIGAGIGGLLAAALTRYAARPRPTFLWVAIVMTVLSCIPSVALPPDIATKMVLVGTHLLAAAMIVPALARQIRR